MFFMVGLAVSSSVLDLPILRRIAEKDKWPPLRIYIYPREGFPNRFKKALNNSRFALEDKLPSLIKKSRIYRSSPDDADFYLVPICLSMLTLDDFSALLEFLKTLGPYYNEYNGANHIFLHARFPTVNTSINPNNFLLHPGHIFTSGFHLTGPPVNSWIFAKNLLLPLQPTTKRISDWSKKHMAVIVDGTLDKCTPANARARKAIADVVRAKMRYHVAETESDVIRLMEDCAFSIVTACESEIATRFYDAVNALSIPIVMNDKMRFPFENELIDYGSFVVHVNESDSELAGTMLFRLEKFAPKMQAALADARKMYEFSAGDGGYVWAIAWSLYMKLLAWLPIRRTTLIDKVIREPTVLYAQ
jgi:hypothetical protein